MSCVVTYVLCFVGGCLGSFVSYVVYIAVSLCRCVSYMSLGCLGVCVDVLLYMSIVSFVGGVWGCFNCVTCVAMSLSVDVCKCFMCCVVSLFHLC